MNDRPTERPEDSSACDAATKRSVTISYNSVCVSFNLIEFLAVVVAVAGAAALQVHTYSEGWAMTGNRRAVENGRNESSYRVGKGWKWINNYRFLIQWNLDK